jgi:hypothetical protein
MTPERRAEIATKAVAAKRAKQRKTLTTNRKQSEGRNDTK